MCGETACSLRKMGWKAAGVSCNQSQDKRKRKRKIRSPAQGENGQSEQHRDSTKVQCGSPWTV